MRYALNFAMYVVKRGKRVRDAEEKTYFVSNQILVPLPLQFLSTYQHSRKTRETSSVEPGCTTTSGTEGILW